MERCYYLTVKSLFLIKKLRLRHRRSRSRKRDSILLGRLAFNKWRELLIEKNVDDSLRKIKNNQLGVYVGELFSEVVRMSGRLH